MRFTSGRDLIAEVATLRRELRDTRMVLAAIVLKHGDREGDRSRLTITDDELLDAPNETATYRQLDRCAIVLVVRHDQQ